MKRKEGRGEKGARAAPWRAVAAGGRPRLAPATSQRPGSKGNRGRCCRRLSLSPSRERRGKGEGRARARWGGFRRRRRPDGDGRGAAPCSRQREREGRGERRAWERNEARFPAMS